jgi:hypothetical protein
MRTPRIAALVLACLMAVSAPLIAAGATGATSIPKTCTIKNTVETKLVWNARHTKEIKEIVYKIVPERATLDGYKPFVDVAVAVVVTKRVCSGT